MAATVAAKNKKVRQDALREMLSKKCTVEQVLANVKKFEEQGAVMEPAELQALKHATDTRLKLLNKYIPDLKQSEIDIKAEDVTGSNREELEARLIAAGVKPEDL